MNGGTTPQVFATFAVTVPAYVPNLNSGAFLQYNPQIDPSGVSIDWSWDEVVGGTTTHRAGVLSTTTGPTAVNVGTSITFMQFRSPLHSC